MTIASSRWRRSTTQNVIRSDTCPARKSAKLEYEKLQLDFDHASYHLLLK